jgi:hypothetical protein
MIRPDDADAALPRGRQRLLLLLPVLFLVGQLLNLLLANATIGSFKTNDVVDAWVLVLCIYAAAVARCCFPADPLNAIARNGTKSPLWPLARFLNLSSVATLGLAIVTRRHSAIGCP